MSERYKIQDKAAIYFLTLAVWNWIDLFTRKNHKLCIVDSLRYCQQNKGLIIFGWCLMSNHLHLLVQAKEENLSEILRDFKKFTSKKLVDLIKDEPESRREWLLKAFSEAGKNLKRIKEYKVWQDGFHPIEITSAKVFFEKLEYIHNNPVKEMVVSEAEDYWFSSARNYAKRDYLLDVILEEKTWITYS